MARRLAAIVSAYVLCAYAMSAADSATDQRAARPPIRALDVRTLETLGREIHRHDRLAWVATDALLAKIDRDKYAADGAAGWVIDVSNPAPVVRFIRSKGKIIEAAYDVVVPAEGEPLVVAPPDRALTATQRAAYEASRAALDELSRRRLPWCGGNPNFVVLPDPDGEGLIAYILRAKPARDAVPIGGHYRVTVSENGKVVEQVDQLFASCLTIPRGAGVPPDGELAALSMSHLVSDTPLETHVFLSLQEKLPFYVITPDGRSWKVDGGRILESGEG